MVGTIGVVLIITLILLINVGQRTSIALATSPQVDEAAIAELEARITEIESRPSPDAIASDIQKATKRHQELTHEVDVLSARRTELAAQWRDMLRSGEREELDHLSKRARELQGELDDRRRRKQISYLIAEDSSDALIVELEQGRLITSRTDVGEAPRLRRGTPDQLAGDILAEYATSSARRPTHLLLAIKPSGVPIWKALTRRLRTDPALAHVQLGIDLIAEDMSTTAMFPASTSKP